MPVVAAIYSQPDCLAVSPQIAGSKETSASGYNRCYAEIGASLFWCIDEPANLFSRWINVFNEMLIINIDSVFVDLKTILF